MRLTEICNRLPSRAPCGLLGSWLRPLPRSTSRCLVAPRLPCGARRRNAGSPWALARRGRGSGACPFTPPTGRADQVELRLTANLLLRPSPQSSRDPRRGARERALRELCPERPRERHSTVLAGPRSWTPPCCTTRPRCFRPRAELATLPLTSSVATLRGSGRETGSPSLRIARPSSPAVSSKTAAFAGPGRLPSPSAPSPGRAPRFRVVRVGSRGARHRCRCSSARGFRHRDPASGALSLLELPPALAGELPPALADGAKGLDPWPFGWTKRRSSTSATNTAREHTHGTARSPPPGGTSVRSRTSPAGLATAKPPAAPASSTRAFRPELRTTTAASTSETGGALAPAPLAHPLAEAHDLARPLAETYDREPFRTRRNPRRTRLAPLPTFLPDAPT
jgi:hypothetical protein